MCFFFTVGLALRTALNGSVSVFGLGPTAEACRSMLHHAAALKIGLGLLGGNHLEERLFDQAQARASYAHFLGVIRVAYPKA